MAINLTLNDFRNVLGKVNDGNVVIKQDQSGIEKANYGSKIANLFRKNVRTAESNPQENAEVRKALLQAIQTSAEGKVLSLDDMQRIYDALGMSGGQRSVSVNDGAQVEGFVDAFSAPLTRRGLKTVIDIIDGATKNDALVKENIDELKQRGVLDESVADAVKNAMDGAGCLNPPSDLKSRVNQSRGIFGADFKGRSPAEVEKFVRQNMAVIREQVFDRLYWSHPSLPDFAHPAEVDNDAFILEPEVDAPKVTADEVSKAFRDVVGDLMEKFAAKATVTTKVETLAQKPVELELLDKNAKSIWDKNVKGSGFEFKVDRVFSALAEDTSSYAAVQLDAAAQALKNQIREAFNMLYKQNGFNAQKTETAFRAEMAPLMSYLDGVAADLNRMAPEDSATMRAKLADALGALVVERNLGINTSALADAARTALDGTTKTFSSRGMVEAYVNENFEYLQDKTPVINFFMERIAAAGQDGGITAGQKEALATAQKAALEGRFGADEKQTLTFTVMDKLKEAYNKKIADEAPEHVRQVRTTRNENAFKALLDANPEYAKMSEKAKGEALVKLKISTLLCAHGYEKMAALGITKGPGSESLRDEYVDGEVRPLQESIDKLEEELCKLEDRDFEFFSQYAAKGMREADRDVDSFSTVLNQGKHETVFKDALRDGTLSISSVPRNAVPMLHYLVTAQIYAPIADNQTVSIRELLPRSEQSSPLSVALFVRLQERFAATGIENVPARLKPVQDLTNINATSFRLQSSGRGDITQVRGFGTFDPARILKLFAEMGIDLSPLDGNDVNAKVDVYEKVFCLSTIAAMSGFKLDGLAEFCERVVGKPFSEVTYTDVMKTLSDHKKLAGDGMLRNIALDDPLAKLTGPQKTAKELFTGEIALSGAKLSSKEATDLLTAARELADGPDGTIRTLPVGGTLVGMKRLPGGGLTLKISGLAVRAAFDAPGLVRMIENEIASKPGAFAPEVVKGALPPIADVESGKVPLVRARELYAKTAAAKTGTLPVMFSAYTTAQLREIAVKAVDGQFKASDLPKVPPASYNSGAMIEMHETLSKTSAADVDSKVKIASPEKPAYIQRCTVPPSAQTVSNIVADLFLNKDTWEFDASAAGKAQPGERVRKLLVEHGPELTFIKKSLANGEDGLLSGLTPQVRDAVKAIFADIAKLNLAGLDKASTISSATRDALAAIEAKINTVANTLVDAMQAKVTALFEPHAGGEVRQDWQKTLAELTGKDGIDESTRQGAFTMKVLKNYFARSAMVDKRAMLSAMIRNTDTGSTDAKQVAELLKGAGPLLQKMLQGLPLSSFDPDTQLALKDMKSRLLPIPEEAVKAQMLELVRSSNGNILSIEVKKSLGAASVGQAFLCTIKTKDHPYIGEECVIKLLRPNVDTAIQREKAMIDEIIGNDPAMKATFDGQYRKILEEFDLTLESTNVGIGTKIYERPKGVETIHTMETLEGSLSTMTSMIIKKADGNTFDNTIDAIRQEAEEVLAPLRHATGVQGNGPVKTVYKASDPEQMALARRKLISKAAKLNDRRNQVLGIARTWFDNALFGNGFFHGDLHGGNLITGPSGTTFIDFGNCSRLSSADQGAMKMMLAAVVSGDTDHVILNFKKLMNPEAKAAFDRKFTKGSPALARLTDILKRGSPLELMSRIQAFAAVVQGEDVPVPASLQNFVQSYVRLCDIVTDIDRTVADIEIAANSIYCDVPELADKPGEPKTCSLLKSIVRAYVGDADTPYSAEAVHAAASDFAAYAATAAGKAEIHALTHDPARVRDELKPLLEALKSARIYNRDELDPVEAGVVTAPAVRVIVDTIRKLDDLDKAGKIQNGQIVSDSKDERGLFDTLEGDMLSLAGGMAKELSNCMSSDTEDGESTFRNTAAKIDNSVTDVCVDVIFGHQNELRGSVISEYGLFGAAGFAGRLETQYDAGTAAARRVKDVDRALAERNRALPPGERLSGQNLATISRASTTFLVQSPRPDADAKWGSSPDKRRDMLEAIGYNLRRVATAMNLGPGEQLSSAAVRHAVLNMGLNDLKLVESFTALKSADYDALLAQAGQADAQFGGNILSTAVAALRGAGVILGKIKA